MLRTKLIAVTYLISDHDLDSLVDRDQIRDHRSRSRIPPDRDRLSDRWSHDVLHTKLIAVTHLIADHDLDRLVDRDDIPDHRSRSRSHI